jgi:hypothetical protein
MSKIKIGPSSPTLKVLKNEEIIWELDSTVPSGKHLKIEAWSFYGEKITNYGGDGENKVKLTMSFSDGTDKDAALTYKLYLVVTATNAETDVTGTTGPRLVIDDIGKPPTMCPDDEEKQLAASYSGTRYESV